MEELGTKTTEEDQKELGEHLEESMEMIDGLEKGTRDEGYEKEGLFNQEKRRLTDDLVSASNV